MKKTFFKTIASIAMITAVATTTHAQVKIGTNPTTIGATNNLEVEATNSKKVAVKSDTGQLIVGSTATTVPTGGTNAAVIIDNGTTAGAIQIKDGTQGTGKVLTSDENGVGTWKESTVIYYKPSFTRTISTTDRNSPTLSVASVLLPAGTYLISYSVLCHNEETIQYAHVDFKLATSLGASWNTAASIPGSWSFSTDIAPQLWNSYSQTNIFTINAPTTIYLIGASESAVSVAYADILDYCSFSCLRLQ